MGRKRLAETETGEGGMTEWMTSPIRASNYYRQLLKELRTRRRDHPFECRRCDEAQRAAEAELTELIGMSRP
jgi:hypothetical protein